MSPTWVHRIAASAFVGLLLLMLAWLLWLHPPDGALMSIALITLVGPLALALRGVLYGRRYTMAWSAILILIYFVHGVTYVAVPGPGQILGAIEIALATIYFIAAVVYLRLASAGHAASAGRTAR